MGRVTTTHTNFVLNFFNILKRVFKNGFICPWIQEVHTRREALPSSGERATAVGVAFLMFSTLPPWCISACSVLCPSPLRRLPPACSGGLSSPSARAVISAACSSPHVRAYAAIAGACSFGLEFHFGDPATGASPSWACVVAAITSVLACHRFGGCVCLLCSRGVLRYPSER